MAKQARVDQVQDPLDNMKTSGWLVIDISDPDNERTVSEHETQADALRAAETFEQEA